MAKIGTGTKDSAWGWHSRLLGRKQQMTPQKLLLRLFEPSMRSGRGGCQNGFSSHCWVVRARLLPDGQFAIAIC